LNSVVDKKSPDNAPISKRIVLIIAGWISLILGIFGIFLPLLPTTPFILLASWCFARSSRYFHNFLLNNSLFGPMIRRWEAGQGITKSIRNRAVTLLWVTMILSMWIIGKWWAVGMLSTIGLCTTWYLCRLTQEPPQESLTTQ
jgi:uncharacterized membrane protein YbaN (DUF454 family)